MGIGILAPVPAIIIDSALETCAREGVVAFGTNAAEVFEKVDREYGAGIPVLIVPTVTYGDSKGYGRRMLSARYVGFVEADRRTGLHPFPARRPQRTLDPGDPDTAARGFWEVADLVFIPAKIPLSSLTAEGRKTPLPASFQLHGPLIVKGSML